MARKAYSRHRGPHVTGYWEVSIEEELLIDSVNSQFPAFLYLGLHSAIGMGVILRLAC